MNGTPQPNRKRLGIEPGSLDHESQPLIIGSFLTNGRVNEGSNDQTFSLNSNWDKKYMQFTSNIQIISRNIEDR